MTSSKLVPVVLSGGVGSRLWPLSREFYPKQLIALTGPNTLIQDTVARVSGRERFQPPIVICSEEQRFLVAEQVRSAAFGGTEIVLEPIGRNTAPAAAIAGLRALARADDALLLLLPADHRIGDQETFLAAVDRAARAAETGAIVTFGVTPTGPETGYGYIKRGEPLDGCDGAYRVERFVEKPDLARAREYLADGGYAWNSGMFLCSAQRLIDEMDAHAPDVLAAAREAVAKGRSDLDFFRLDRDALARGPSISIDYAVMEKTPHAAVVTADFPWSDIGSWSSLWEQSERNGDGNATRGDVMIVDTRNSYVRSDGLLTAVVGVDDLIVVTTDDAVLVASRDRAQEVKAVVDRLKQEDRPEARFHTRVYRPWGYHQSLHHGDRFQVKRITVNPGARLSLQRHFHRAEHWVVVNGTALVTRGDEEVLVRENESVYLPLGCVHRLTNPGKVPLNLIEVQSGPYLQEDDIERLEDDYARE